MNGKNCPNCAAVYTLEDVKCPYCGTLYYDLSAIDFTQDKPVFLKFRMPYGDRNVDIIQCAIPRLDTMEFKNEYADAVSSYGTVIKSFCTGKTLTTNVQFHAIQYGKDKNLFEIRMKE